MNREVPFLSRLCHVDDIKGARVTKFVFWCMSRRWEGICKSNPSIAPFEDRIRGIIKDWGSRCMQPWRLWQITTLYKVLTKSYLLLYNEGIWKPFLDRRRGFNFYAIIQQQCCVSFLGLHNRCKGCVHQLHQSSERHFEARSWTVVYIHSPSQVPIGKTSKQLREPHVYLRWWWLPYRECQVQSTKDVTLLHICWPSNPSLLFKGSQ